MKTFLKKLFILIAVITAVSTTTSLATSAPTYAFDNDCRTLLGMTSWDCGVEETWNSTDDIPRNVLKIASNVLADITVLSAYLVLGFVIYGGYLYIFSSGDPTKAANSRKVLTRAFIGLAIILLANVIFNAIRIALIGDTAIAGINESINVDQMVTDAINWVISVAGIVALIFVIIGAVGYMTSSGDSAKLTKAKNTLTYALIGLVIVGLAAVITAFVSNLIRSARDNTSYINNTIIAKELK